MDIITIGSATIDVFCKTDDEYVEIKSSKDVEKLIAFKLGSKLLIHELNFLWGGGGTNTAVTFARVGLKTGYLGKISDDNNGKEIIRNLSLENVKFLGPVHKVDSFSYKKLKKLKLDPEKIRTGYSVILESLKKDRTILTHKGINDYLFFDEIENLDEILSAKNIYSSSMDKASLKTLIKIIDSYEGNFYFNPSEYMIENHFEEVLKLILNTDYLILNRDEAELILRKQMTKNTNKRLQDVLIKESLSVEEKKFLSQKLISMGCKNSIITDGSDEVFALIKGEEYSIKPSKLKTVVDTTGAGDAFASAFAAWNIKTNDVRLALKNALKNAQSVIGYYGAKTGILKNY